MKTRAFATAAVVFYVVMASACDGTELSAPLDGQRRPEAVQSLGLADGRTDSEFTIEHTADIQLLVAGTLKPGTPSSITARVKSRGFSGPASVRFYAALPESQATSGRMDRESDVTLSGGNEASRSMTTTFDKPGYYRVLAAATTKGALQPDGKGGTVEPTIYAQAWVLVTPNGGRVDAVYDTTVAELAPYGFDRGTSGAFLPAPSSRVIASPNGTSRFMMSGMGTGTLSYLAQDSLNASRPVAGARISGWCRDSASGLASSHAEATTNAAGQFTIYCNPGESHFTGMYFLENSSVTVPDPHVSFRIEMGGHLDVSVVTDARARVFLLHNRYNAAAATRFGVSRGQILYSVSVTPGVTATDYQLGGDYINIGYNYAFATPGPFYITHEYGHAFHDKAIETPPQYSCPGTRGVESVTDLICAYTEGFATFFSAWMRNVDTPVGLYHQGAIESHSYGSIGNGAAIEGAVAGFLLDLVDSASDNDGISGDDDNNSISGALLANVMKHCRLSSPSASALSRSDQFVYCVEGNVGLTSAVPSTYQSSWAAFGSVTFDVSLVLPYAPDVRASWLKNFYNL